MDSEDTIVYANRAAEILFKVDLAVLKAYRFPRDFDLRAAESEASQSSAGPVAAFQFGAATGEVALSVMPLSELVDGSELQVVNLYDRSPAAKFEKTLELERKRVSELDEELINLQAELLVVNDQLNRKVTQTDFLLKFYARTRFALEADSIARHFLQLACTGLGFRHGFYFAISEKKTAWRLGSYFYPDIDSTQGARLQAEADHDVRSPSFNMFTENVGVFTSEMLERPNLIDLYKPLGLENVKSGAVFTLRKGTEKNAEAIGEFHFLNYLHNVKVDETALAMLNYMVDPVHLTFENAELYRTSVTDELTQINNVRYFRLRLRSEMMRAARDKKPLSMLMLDIDHFKQINDKYGHPVGDQAIRAMANALKMGVRGGDVVARYGGEEMAAILPGANLETATRVAERLRANIAEIEIASDKGPVKFTTSIGVSLFPDHAEEMEKLISAADQALYRAKREGRNRVIAF